LAISKVYARSEHTAGLKGNFSASVTGCFCLFKILEMLYLTLQFQIFGCSGSDAISPAGFCRVKLYVGFGN
jgi:hypothetical protein